jgi:Tol biopolymer transport system component
MTFLAFGLFMAAMGQDPSPKPATGLPLTPTRTIRFTTDEGTWLSVDVSPDGRRIVFDLVGDLYTMPIEGGRATRITDGPAWDAAPRYSPDGATIAFVSDRSGSDNLWVADADGRNPRAVTKTEGYGYVSPEWTPDGRALIATRRPAPREREEGNDLYLYYLTGGAGLKIAGPEPASAARSGAPPRPRSFLGAAFGPDPRWIYAAATGTGGWNNWQVAVIDRTTGEAFVRTGQFQSAMRPTLSRDGRWLVYATRKGAAGALKLRDLTTGDERWLVENGQRDDQEGAASRDLAPGSSFTPDGQALITSYGGKIMRVEVPSGRAAPIPFTADVEQTIGPLAKFEYPADPDTVVVRHVQWPRPSPDGKRIAFTALARLYVMDLAGGTARRLTDAAVGEHSPVWSPDGAWIAYATWSDSTGGEIYRTRSDGTGRPERVTRAPAYYDKLAWSPDGARLVAVRAPRRERLGFYDELNDRVQWHDADLVWMPAAGGPVTPITPLALSNRYIAEYYGVPHFTKDSTRIWIHDQVDGLVSMRWDGTDRRSHLKIKAWDWPGGDELGASDIQASPNGDQALVLVNQKLYLVAIAEAGGQAPAVAISTLASAPVPARKLSPIGADFPGWSRDGRTIHYGLGASYFEYDVARADQMVRDSAAAADAKTAAPPRYEARRVDIAIRVPKSRPNGTIALRGARLITMKGSEVVENGTVVVTGNRITAVGPANTVTVPAGARVIDVSGKTILPGYVDIHAHMWPPWGIYRQQNWQYLVNLAYGVTTTRDPQTMTPDVIAYSDLVAAGRMLGPRIFTTARGIHATEEIHSLDDARNVVRRYSEFWQTQTIKQYMVGDRKVRQWVAMAATEQRVTPTVEGGQDLKMNLTLMLDGYAGLEHSLPIWPLYRDVSQLVAQSGITYTPTLIVSYGGPSMFDYFIEREHIETNPTLKHFLPEAEIERIGTRRTEWVQDAQWGFPNVARAAASIVAAGGRVGMGSHGNMQGLGVHWELWAFALGGMPTPEILRTATMVGAEAIGLGKDLGSLEPGKLADLQVLDKNPLEAIRNTDSIRWVMIGGRLLDAKTLQGQ